MTAPLRDPAPRGPAPRPTAELRALGARLYKDRCAACHGVDGDGRGSEAARLAVAPRNFTTGVYKLRSTPSGSIPTDADLFISLSRGMHGTPMLPWSALKERERWALVHHLKSLSVRFREERPEPPVAVPAAPPQTDALRARGKQLYSTLRCWACHGERGAGDGPAAPLLIEDPSRPVRIRDFVHGRFLRGTEPADIYLTLWTGLDGTSMGTYASALSPDETWALAAFVRSLVRERPYAEPAAASAVPAR